MHLEPLINVVNQSTLTPEKIETLAAINRDTRRLDWLAEKINAATLASIDVVLETYYQAVDRRYRANLLRFQQLPSNPPGDSAIHVTAGNISGRSDALAAAAADWMRGGLLMHDLLRARGIPYFGVLQPNQYHSLSLKSRTFTDAERRVAFSDQSPFKEGAEKGYPLLEKALVEAKASRPEAHLLDGTHIFDAIPDAVYMDNCCHYTLKGNDVLADFIARAVIAAR